MASFFLLPVIFILLGAHGQNAQQKCISDADCSVDTYCQEDICLECFNCQLLRRRPNATCAKSVFECGRCLPGYKEVAVTILSRVPKACEKLDTLDIGGCFADTDCGAGNFCSDQNSCIPCVDCSTFSRQASTACAKEIQDCGLCLPGFDSVPVTLGSRPKPCHREQSAPLVSQNMEVNVNVSAISLIGAVGTVAVIVLCIVLVLRSRRSPKPACPDEPSPPPPYTDMDASETSQTTDPEETTVCAFYKEGVDDADCTARIFKLPEYATRHPHRSFMENGARQNEAMETVDSPCRPNGASNEVPTEVHSPPVSNPSSSFQMQVSDDSGPTQAKRQK